MLLFDIIPQKIIIWEDGHTSQDSAEWMMHVGAIVVVPYGWGLGSGLAGGLSKEITFALTPWA